MSLETELRAYLAADGGVSALVAARIYPLRLPQGPTYPALVYQRISGPRLKHLSGAAGMGVARIQVDAWAATYAGAQALAAAVRAALHGYKGLLTTITASASLDNELDADEEKPEVYRVIQDYLIHHTE